MSITVLALAKSFSTERLTADEFSNSYMELWKFERDSNLLQEDEDNLNECLSSIFCLADLYNPDADREEYELDEEQLRVKVMQLIENLSYRRKNPRVEIAELDTQVAINARPMDCCEEVWLALGEDLKIPFI